MASRARGARQASRQLLRRRRFGSAPGTSGLKSVYRDVLPDDKWKQAKIVAAYTAVAAFGVYVYAELSAKQSTSVAAKLVDKAGAHEAKIARVTTENERIKLLRLAEEKYLEAIEVLDASLAEGGAGANYYKADSKSVAGVASLADTKGLSWAAPEVTERWYPRPPANFKLPTPESEEGIIMIRALQGLAQLKRRTKRHEQAEATQLRLVGTLREMRGIDSIQAIEAFRELAWMYKNSKPPKAGDAILVLRRSLHLAENSRTVRGNTMYQIVAALSEDLSLLYREQHDYVSSCKFAEKAVTALERGEGGKTDPRCGVLWTAITADWVAQDNLDEAEFAAKEAVRVADSTHPAHQDHWSPGAWQCCAHSNMLAMLLRKDPAKMGEYLEKALALCPSLEEDQAWEMHAKLEQSNEFLNVVTMQHPETTAMALTKKKKG